MSRCGWILAHAALLLTSMGCATGGAQDVSGLFVEPPKAVPKEILDGPRAGLSKRLGDLLSGTRSELDAIDEKYRASLSQRQSELSALRKSEAPTAKAKLPEAQAQYDAEHAQQAAEQVDVRYARGARLLDEMIASTKTTERVIDAVTLGKALPEQKNHWRDAELRNDYDAICDWGLVSGAGVVIVGGVVMAIGGGEARPATGTGNEGVTTLTIGGMIVAAGAAIVAVSAILGHLAGEEDGDRLKEKAAAIEETRRIHDGLLVRIERLEAFRTSLSGFLQQLEAFRKGYDGAGEDVDKRRAKLAALGRQLERFTTYAERLSELLDWFASTAGKYADAALSGKLADDMSQLGSVVSSAQRLFRDGVSGFLARHDDITELFAER